VKNYRFFGQEMEALGNRLDAARACLASANSEWAKNYWKQAVESLLLQWRALPALHDGEAQTTIIPKWEVKYNYYEKSEELPYSITDRLFDSLSGQANLDWSWENHRAQRLAKAQ